VKLEVKLERVQALKLPYGGGDYVFYEVLGSRRGLFLTDSERYMCRVDPDDYTVSWEIPWKRAMWQKFVADTLVASHGATVWGLNPDTGETLWEHEANGWVEHGEDRLLLFTGNGGYTIINPRTGAVDCRVTASPFRGHAFCIDSRSAVLVGEKHENQILRGFDFETRQIRWELSLRRDVGLYAGADELPIFVGTSSDKSILVVRLGRNLVAVRVSDGSVVWHREPNGDHTPPRSAAGLTFIIEDRDLVCFDIASGDIAWRKPPDQPHHNFHLASDKTYAGFVVLGYGCERICLASPQDGTIHATYTGDAGPRVEVWSDGVIVFRNHGHMDLLAVGDRSTPTRQSTETIAVSTPSSAARERRAEDQRARRPIPPPVRTIEVIATILARTAGENPAPVVGPDAVYVVMPEATTGYVVQKLARPSYERVWRTSPLGGEPKWATESHLVCGHGFHHRVEAFDTADGRSLWSADSHRGASWAWRDLIVTSPPVVAEIRLLDPSTGRCERTIRRPLPRLCHVSGDLALVCATRHGMAGASGWEIDPFAVVDLETGQLKWQGAIFERFPAEDGSLGSAEILGVGSRVAVVWAGQVVAGIDLTTGDLAWKVSIHSSSRRPYFARNRVWTSDANTVQSIDTDTGKVTIIKGRGEIPEPCAIWGDYVVSLATKGLDLYHLDGTSMRLKLRNEARTAIEASPDLILVEHGRLRIVRQIPPTSGTR
jgi:outer membrane protein assembly factor BamB